MQSFGIYHIPLPTPMLFHMLPYKLLIHISICLIIMAFGLLIGVEFNKYTKMKWQSANIFNLILPAAATGLLYIRFGISMTNIKGIILFLILLFAANSDLKIREVSNWVPFTIFITGFIGISLKDLPMMFIGALLLPLPLLISALINPYSIGGADYKGYGNLFILARYRAQSCCNHSRVYRCSCLSINSMLESQEKNQKRVLSTNSFFGFWELFSISYLMYNNSRRIKISGC